jgi:hypothetical protein
VAGLVWLFVDLGAEQADRISSGVGAGAAVMGLIVAALGVMKRRADTQDDRNTKHAVTRQSVTSSVINGSNVQVGGSVHGFIATEGDLGDQEQMS